METKQIYMRFLNLLHALEGGENAPEMDLEAKKLLEVIAVHEANKNPLTVTAAMNLGHIASPATIHRKIDDLRIAGLVDTEFQGDNRRTKYLTPTPRARKYFDKVNALLPRAQATS